MYLPAFFGRKNSINLLPKDSFEASSFGILLTWAMTFGKWAVILTQLVVMAVFLARFGYDRKLADLRKDIAHSAGVVKSYSEIEQDFRIMQKSVEYTSQTMKLWDQYQEMIANTENVTPLDVWYERLIYTPTNFSISAYSSSLTGFGKLLTDIQNNPKFSVVNIGSIEDGSAKGARLKFDISMTVKESNARK